MSALKIKDAQGQWIEVPMIKGDKGDKGDTYELTQQDKQDIADLVDIPEPLKYVKDDPSDNGGVIEGFVEVPDGAIIGTKTNLATGMFSHAEGGGYYNDAEIGFVSYHNEASGMSAHAEGQNTTASGIGSHSEGYVSRATGVYSHAEGSVTVASGEASHSEGYATTASGARSHVEGNASSAQGQSSHAEGTGSLAQGTNSHAEGNYAKAIANNSHAEGGYTIASSQHQHVQGKYNVEDSQGIYADIVGNGTNDKARSNAYTLDWQGNGVYAGKVTVGTAPTNDMDVATKKYVDDVKGASIHICSSSEYDPTTGVPTIQNPDEKTFYLVPSEDGTSPDLFVEWAYVNNAWEMFGSASIDLSGYLTDVQVDGTSIVTDGVASIPKASTSSYGVVLVGNGLQIQNEYIKTKRATDSQLKAGAEPNAPIVPINQHVSSFYGLAKAAGHDEKNSTLALGQYTPEAKGAIQSMLGIDSLIAPTETNPFTNAHAIGELFIINGTLYKAKTAIAVNDVLDDGVNAEAVSVDDVVVKDVQIDGTSIMQDGVASIPIASKTALGAVKTETNYGILTNNAGRIYVDGANSLVVKTGTDQFRPITPFHQHESAFYGLAKASGDTTQSASSNAVGQYTDEAKTSIKQMLGVVDSYDSLVVNVTGTDPVITGSPSYRYNCGEVTSLTVTPPSSGTIDIIFTSGTTPTVLDLPQTVKMPSWWIGVEANTTYEMCITDGVYCGVMSWDV